MTTSELETRAKKALTETLGRMFGVDFKDMQRACAKSDRPSGILAHIGMFGHSHTLACAVERDGEPAHIHAALCDFLNRDPHVTESATPVIFAPYLSPAAQIACKDASAGFLDLEGDARLSVDELFIAERSFPCRVATRAVLSPRNGKSRIIPRLRVRRRFRDPRNFRDRNDNDVPDVKSCPEVLISGSEAETTDAQQGKELSQQGGL
ncbi:MAG: hypothetical protein ABSA54_21320 [Terriglobales bacterium]|jgi:hypothetical protein